MQQQYDPWVEVPANLPQRYVQTLKTRPASLGSLDPIDFSGLDTKNKVMIAVQGVILLAVAYHGYKRNGGSPLWGAAWALGGFICPTVTLAFALSGGLSNFAREK